MKQLIKGVLIALLICVVQLQATSHTTQNNQQECNITGESKLYQEWVEQWKGKYETDIYYHQVGTPYAIKDMLEQCDILGLTLMLNDIDKREFIFHQASGGMIFLMVAIESAYPQSVQFLLEHKLTQKDNKDIYEEQMIEETIEGLTPLQLANQKLQEVKAKGDSKAIANYEKILEILKEYSVK
ncbi:MULTISPECIES: hypothetical protein [Helicobacter]|uniref:Uncharacterized protein n=3 Tax=Helicobacter TaxID=209 RepID=T1DVH8_9HELI|nr:MULTISPECIES: hypothetical protein [Helicobacter]QOQ95425.1 hypothetical protein HW245_07120 [Helicobacter cinaedi]GAD18557.1 hypothetical protein HFN_1969 [Helicobacter fennelliae MRY12-0050]STP07293.1 Uncharacterised protein [Helicobacter fennelliae]